MQLCVGYSVYMYTPCITYIITITYYILSSPPKLLFFFLGQLETPKLFFIKLGRLLSFKLLLNQILTSFIWEILLSTEAIVTWSERQIAPTLHKLQKWAFKMSFEASSFNCTFISFLTNSWRYIFHSVVISEVMMASFFIKFHAESWLVFLIHSALGVY